MLFLSFPSCCRRACAAVGLGLSVSAPVAHADVTFDQSESGNCFPFGACPDPQPMLYRQAYSHFQFGADALQIDGVRFKPDQSVVAPIGSAPFDLTITLTTALSAPDQVTPTFAVGAGTPEVVVFSGTAVLASSGANVFDLAIPFTTPYVYDPSAGNLVLTLDVRSGGVPRRGFAAGGSLLVSRDYGGTIEAGYGLATQFISASSPEPLPLPEPPVSAVPEPAAFAFLLMGIPLLGRVARRRGALAQRDPDGF